MYVYTSYDHYLGVNKNIIIVNVNRLDSNIQTSTIWAAISIPIFRHVQESSNFLEGAIPRLDKTIFATR